ncbi:Gp138 family membrane-puncturing spike protein [Pseudomonas brenneri]|uniref:Gp138 family membrane-puncturing spike protein n=1 Tax=Pseudomonas brenneri TaxID=129817 RepID=UPI0025A01491|nr:Gp138 family membrane-puncturing spike protein [Pseudomonas brenneri]WJM94080.1 Gp138 family membrane-puncturing spike protein [Pseudomonas brenneri]
MEVWKPILTHYPGRIVEFDPVRQVAKVRVMREQYNNQLHSLYTEYAFPILQDVPVQFPQGGGYFLTFPVSPGDNCLLDFCDKGISHWKYHGTGKIGVFQSGVPKADYFRAYNINDAVAMVGYNPIPQAIPEFNATSTELRNVARTQRFTMLPEGKMEIITPTELDITAPETVINGNTTINGNLKVVGKITCTDTIHSDVDVTATTVSLVNHLTTGVVPGSGVSNKPQV